MRSITLVMLLLITIINGFADTTAITNEGKKVILKSDGTWQYIQESKSNETFKYAGEAVSIWDISLQHWNKDADARRYSSIVTLTFHFQNHTNKKVVGVAVLCVIKNPFDKELLRQIYENEVVIQPDERMKNDFSWIMEDNPFINNQPYDLLKVVAMNGTAKIDTRVLKVIFEDGTVLKGK